MNPPEKRPSTKPTRKRQTPYSKKFFEYVSLIKSKAPTQKHLSSILFSTQVMLLRVRSLEDVPLEKLSLHLKQAIKSEQMYRTSLSNLNLEKDFENVSLHDLERYL